MNKYILLSILIISSLAHSFTYQGELSQTGFLYTGTEDISFKLFDVDINGSQVGIIDSLTSVTVSNGRFAVTLDQWLGLYDCTPLKHGMLIKN